jgi:S1-C subfamily serine protease
MNKLLGLLLVVVAALAGAAGAVAVGAVGSDTTHTTVVRTVPAAQPAAQKLAKGLSAGDIYKQDAPGVVVVTATSVTSQQNPFDPFGAPQQQQQQALGSGFVIDGAGHILTNAHVVLNAQKVQVGFSNGKTYSAKVLGLDRSSDVAVLKVDVPSDALSPLTLGTAKDVHVGDPVVAIGNPLGEDRTITSGIISAKAREIDSLVPGTKIFGALQTDAAINHGNSGGPLIDANGRVIGITSQILSENNGNVGIGFAIPIDTARRVAGQIMENGKATHTFLGIEGTDLNAQVAHAVNLPVTHGSLVAQVVPGSPAAKAGLRGGSTQATIGGETLTLGGDIITQLNGHPVTSFDNFAQTISAHRPGDKISLTLVHGGKTRTVSVTLAARGASG